MSSSHKTYQPIFHKKPLHYLLSNKPTRRLRKPFGEREGVVFGNASHGQGPPPRFARFIPPD